MRRCPDDQKAPRSSVELFLLNYLSSYDTL
nr:MAG TPA: hypothetical protein [Caudoviricetes sp.]